MKKFKSFNTNTAYFDEFICGPDQKIVEIIYITRKTEHTIWYKKYTTKVSKDLKTEYVVIDFLKYDLDQIKVETFRAKLRGGDFEGEYFYDYNDTYQSLKYLKELTDDDYKVYYANKFDTANLTDDTVLNWDQAFAYLDYLIATNYAYMSKDQKEYCADWLFDCVHCTGYTNVRCVRSIAQAADLEFHPEKN